ncbi:MAG: amino acid ABC transporter substrate-binding protein, partial [Actinomycetota bacterium]|nr:amino acid ABC transporter substrate-binding protein [Actinomycetota bacterium]
MRTSVWLRLLVLALAMALIGGACTRGEEGEQTDGGDTAAENTEDDTQEPGQGGGGDGETLLTEIQDRGTLRCGINNEVPGFGFQNPDTNEIEGFDIDFCKAFAAAIFGDPEQHELVPVTSDDRFIALRGGDFDVLVRNTTWTSSRDGTEGLAFTHPNFYDGQAMMVKADQFSSIEEMDGASVCVTTGTTTELNLADYFQELGMDFKPVAFEENPQIQEAFIAGRCDGWTSDRSQLAGLRSQFPQSEGGPESLVIFEDVMSKEPLTPAVLD